MGKGNGNEGEEDEEGVVSVVRLVCVPARRKRSGREVEQKKRRRART
jgi:hypothetical protein